MLAERLKQYEYVPLLTTSTGNTYIGKEIARQIELTVRAFSCLGISSEDTIGIYCANEMYGIATMLACLSYGTNFTVLDVTDDIEDTKVKIVLSNATIGLIVSETLFDESLITMNPDNFKILSKGWSYFTLDEVEKQQVNQIYDIVESLNLEKWMTITNDNLKGFIFDKSPSYAYLVGINFHIGMSKGIFNASRFKLESIIAGIEEAINNYPAKTGKVVLTVEPFNLLYDIVNGMIAPLFNGKHVIIRKNSDFYDIATQIRKSKADILYVSAFTLRWTILGFKKEVSGFSWLKSWRLKRLLKRELGNKLKHVIVTGPVRDFRKTFNHLRVKYSNLYVMNEVVSYIASATFHRIPRVPWLKPRLNVSLSTLDEHSDYGEINIICDDLFHSYLNDVEKMQYYDTTIFESSPKDVSGKFKSEDVGMIRNNKLFVYSKAKNIFVNERGVVIESGKILMIARRFEIVNEAAIVVHKNRLVLLVELDFEYINDNYTDKEGVFNDLKKIKTLVNKNVRPHSQINKVIWISNPDGLHRKNYRIISNHF